MRRRALLAAGFVVLLFAGVATAGVLARKITLHSGACVTVAKTRICAAKASTVTRSRVLTVTTPGNTVTEPAPPAVTVTVTAPAPTPPPPSSPVTLDFSGNGSGNIAPFTLPVGETFAYTVAADAFGNYENFITDCGFANGWIGTNALGVPNGSTYIPAGTYSSCSIIAESSWTIHIS